MSGRGRHLLAGALAVPLCALCACGSANGGRVIARVGTTAIAGAALAHWMSVLAPRHAVPGAAALRHELRARTLEYLISTAWLVDAAARLGAPVTSAQVRAAVAQREASLGRAEFVSSLAATDHTVADVELEVRREIAAATIRRSVYARVPAPTAAQVSRYYRENLARFEHAERRWFYIVEAIPTVAKARAMIRAFVDGRQRISTPGTSLYEKWDRPRDMRRARAVVKALFAAQPRTIVGPIDVEGRYFIVSLTRIRSAFTVTLAQARRRIAAKLVRERRRAAIGDFLEAWRSSSRAATDCEPGYVVQQCRQHRGARVEADPLSAA